jgi:hypothetical protein
MDVAVGDRGFRPDLRGDLGTITKLDVHGVVSFTANLP